MSDKKRIALGSGKIYIVLYDGEMPEITTIKTETNRLGLIQGGASIEYTPTFYEAKDDLGEAVKSVITDEVATLKCGIMTVTSNVLAKLSDTATVTSDTTKKTNTLKIGGIGNMKNNKYVILFSHEDSVDGNIDVLIVGRNEAGFTLTFAKDKETVIDAQFKCFPQDSVGTLIQIIEEVKTTETA